TASPRLHLLREARPAEGFPHLPPPHRPLARKLDPLARDPLLCKSCLQVRTLVAPFHRKPSRGTLVPAQTVSRRQREPFRESENLPPATSSEVGARIRRRNARGRLIKRVPFVRRTLRKVLLCRRRQNQILRGLSVRYRSGSARGFDTARSCCRSSRSRRRKK